MWQASLTLDADEAEAVEIMLEPLALAVSRFEAGPASPLWRVDALFEAEPDLTALQRALGPLAAILTLAPLPQRNWVLESLERLPPVSAGRFYIHGAHHPKHANPGQIDLEIEAGLAFGSGQHESTLGCLLVLDRLARQRRYRDVLDLGCGSGILALAAARIWRRKVLATDIDPVAARVTMANARLNGLAALVTTEVADGLRRRRIEARAPFDLVFANILARPLVRLAPQLVRHLATDGVLVLSGLLAAQAQMVLAAYRLQGLYLVRRRILGAWCVLTLARRKGIAGRLTGGRRNSAIEKSQS